MHRLLACPTIAAAVLAGSLVATPALASPAPAPAGTRFAPPPPLPAPQDPMAMPESGTVPVAPDAPARERRELPEAAAASPGPADWYTPTTHFRRNDDGTVTADIAAGTAYRRDGAGGWKATRKSLVASPDAAWPLSAPDGFRSVQFGRSPSKLLRVDLGGSDVVMSAPGLDVQAPVATGGRFARYRDVAKDTDLLFEPGAGGVKHQLVLRSASAPRSFRFHLSDPTGALGDPVLQPDGGYVFTKEIDDDVRLAISPAVAFEQRSAGEAPVGEPGSAHLSVTRAGDGFDIVEWVDESWLAGKSFPVVLDPTLTYKGSAHLDCYLVSDNYANQGNCNAGALMTGNGLGGEPLGTCGTGSPQWCITRSLMKFDVSTLPRGSDVTSATVKLWQFDNQNSNTFDVAIYNNNQVFTSAATWNRYNSTCTSPCWSGGASGSHYATTTVTGTDGFRSWALDTPNIVESWRNSPSTNGGLIMRILPESRASIGTTGRVVGFYTNTVADSTKWPLLTVNYTPPPAPVVSKTVAAAPAHILSPNGFFARNSVARYTITATSSVTQDDVTIKDVFPAGIKVFSSTIKLDGVACGSLCTVGSTSITRAGLDFTAGQVHTLTYDALVTGVDERQCSNIVNTVTSTGQGGGTNAPSTHTDSNTAVVCDVGLGIEPWWSYIERQVSAAGKVQVNVANGNAVVTHEDSSAIAGRGDLAFGLRRTYNSQDSRVVALPGGLPKGWQLNFGEVSGTGATSPSGLVVPPLSTLSTVLPIVLVDRDGTRHTFQPRTTQPLRKVLRLDTAQSAMVPEPGALATLVPRVLAAAVDTSKYNAVCVDVAYAPPPGVHLGLWRYTAINDTGALSPCTSGPNTLSGKLLGFSTMRPDRYRNEFTWDGRLLSQLDGAGNELRYVYGALPLAGTVTGLLTNVFDASECTEAQAVAANSTCRSYTLGYDAGLNLTTVLDPAGRTTTYEYDTSLGFSQLMKVTAPDGSAVHYTYADGDAATCAPNGQVPLRGQLCSIRDERDVVTRLRYESSTTGQIGRVTSVQDRWGTNTTFAYVSGAQTDVVTNGVQKKSFKLIDSVGRVGQLIESDLAKTYRQTDFTWDSGCRFPTAGTDNNLCKVFRMPFRDSQTGVANGIYTGDRSMVYTYNDEGQTLSSKVTDGAYSNTTTYGYETQFVQTSSTTTSADTVTGYGAVTTGARPATAGLVYAISDRSQSLTPRGNSSTNAATYTKYLTTYHVDNNASVSPNTAPPAPLPPNHGGAVLCTQSNPTVPTWNTGVVCQVDSPPFDGTTTTVARYTYDHFGAKRTATSPKAMNDPLPQSGVRPHTLYTYYDNGSTDLSGLSSASGWLKGVTDPYGKFVAFGYDRAGNVARSWDRNATARGLATSSANVLDSYPANGVGGYAQQTFGSHANPWRHVTEKVDPLGNKTTYTNDASGNPLRIRPPRGNVANDDSFDTVQTFHDGGRIATKITPTGHAEGGKAWRYVYDAYGNQTAVADPLAHPDYPALRGDDPNGHTTVTAYDGVNRKVSETWTRTASQNEAAGGCTQTGAAAPLSAGRYFCRKTFAYDGHDNLIATGDPDQQVTKITYDAFGQEWRRDVPRSATVLLRSETRFDNDGNLIRTCSAREFDASETNEALLCLATGQHSVEYTYDHAGRQSSVQVRRDGTNLTTTRRYNPDGALESETAPKGGTTTYTNDLNGRRTATSVQRDVGVSHTTTTTYDDSGNVLSVTKPGAPGAPRVTAFAYDEAHRLVETVEGSSSTTASLAGATSADGGANVHSGLRYDADGYVVARIDPRAYRDGSGAPSATPPGSTSTTPFMTRYDVDAEGRVIAEYRPRYDGSTAFGDNPVSSEQTSQCTAAKQPSSPVYGARDLPGYTSSTAVCVARRAYDPIGNVVRSDLATGNGNDNRHVMYTYTDDSLLSKVHSPDPAQPSATARVVAQSVVYDGSGRALSVSSASPAPSEQAYVVTRSYTGDGLVLQQTEGVAGRTTTYGYDHNGNTKSAQNSLNETTSWTYFSDNRLKSTTNALTETTSYSYDLNGNTSDVVPPLLQGTALTRHSEFYLDNLLRTTTVPVKADGTDVRRTIYGYDDGGRQTSVTNDRVDGSGAVTKAGGTQQFAYYPSDRSSAETGRENETISRTYDAAGFPATTTNTPVAPGSAVTTTVSSYLDGLPRSVTQNGRTVSFAYDGSGAIALRRVDDGAVEVTAYAHNDAGHTTGVTSDRLGPNAQISIGYDSAGRLTSQTSPNGTVVARGYLPDNRVSTQVLTGPSGPLASWRYGYDALGRVWLAARDASSTAECPTEVGTALPAAGVQCFYYDAAERLHDFKDAAGDKPVRHDANGNRKQYGTASFDFNLDDTIAAANGTPHHYDGAGRLERDGAKHYCYDGFDRTRDMRVGGTSCDGAVTNGVSYAYDGLDRQVSRTETGAASTDPGTTSLFYDGTASTLLAETRPGSVEVDYLPVGSATVHVEQTGGTAVEQFLTDDGRGNVSTATTTSGTVGCSLRYDAYGTSVGGATPANACSTGSTPSSIRYGGQRQDAVSGTYQLGSRTYDPSKASFLTEDVYRGQGSDLAKSVGTDPLTMNRYSFVNGDPVNFTDPSGHEPRETSGGWSGFGCAQGQCWERPRPTPSPTPGASPDPNGAPREESTEEPVQCMPMPTPSPGDPPTPCLPMPVARERGERLSFWQHLRASRNAKWTLRGIAYAKSGGADCQYEKDGIVVCYNHRGKAPSHSAFVVGNVIITSWTKDRFMNEGNGDFFKHEIRHTTQWAILGGELMIGLSGNGALWSTIMTGGKSNACWSIIEYTADWSDGGYDECTGGGAPGGPTPSPTPDPPNGRTSGGGSHHDPQPQPTPGTQPSPRS